MTPNSPDKRKRAARREGAAIAETGEGGDHRQMRGNADSFDFRAALSAQLDAAEAALADRSDKGVHQGRVALKRARALARAGKVAAPGIARVFNDAARAAMAALSPARDLAAMAAIARIAAPEGGRGAGLRRAAAAFSRAAEAVAAPAFDDAARGVADLRALANVWPAPSPRQLEAGVARLRKLAKRAARATHGVRDVDARHRWRKREKDRLYVALLADDLWPRGVKRRRTLSRRLARTLGEENDLAMLIARLHADPTLAGSQASADGAIAILETRLAKRARRADRLGQRLHRGKS